MTPNIQSKSINSLFVTAFDNNVVAILTECLRHTLHTIVIISFFKFNSIKRSLIRCKLYPLFNAIE